MRDFLISVFVWFTGIFFLVIFFPFTFLIWLVTFPFDKKKKIMHRLLVWQSKLLVNLIPVWDVEIRGKKKAGKDEIYVIISNHLSIIDILVINTLGLRFKWVSKIENAKVPILGWYLRMADYLMVDRENDESKAEMLVRALEFLKEGTSVMIFPEGTRSAGNMPGFFKRGAFQLAISAGVPLLPLVIDGTAGILPKHGRIIRGHHKIVLSVLEPVSPEEFGTADPQELGLKFRSRVADELEKIRKEN